MTTFSLLHIPRYIPTKYDITSLEQIWHEIRADENIENIVTNYINIPDEFEQYFARSRKNKGNDCWGFINYEGWTTSSWDKKEVVQGLEDAKYFIDNIDFLMLEYKQHEPKYGTVDNWHHDSKIEVLPFNKENLLLWLTEFVQLANKALEIGSSIIITGD